ncbi:hypothetical protein HBB16_20635 [Pseudonocardia sp. MCCB 268]|nr:hypothetical protein [Pseudonocardia cytotoxica]
MALPSVFRARRPGRAPARPHRRHRTRRSIRSARSRSHELQRRGRLVDRGLIAAETLCLPRQQMRSRPNTINAAGYRDITDVRSRPRARGRRRRSCRAVPHWQELFDNLLPAHRSRIAPGG